jgi:pyruvate formate lyase activating enzyme
MKGLIFNVRRYSIHDGPGIRVTFFFKGCPLRCRWCHNPEGISPLNENIIQTNRVGDKEFSHTEEVGKYYSVDDILEILEKERVFMDKSGGGVTFSGGEPMLQTDFLLAVLKACRSNGFHTAIDTSGYAPSESFKLVIPYTDLFLFDLKHLDEKAHSDLTGVSNTIILDNFRMLLGSSTEVMVRIPVIPGLNDDQDHIGRLRDFLMATKTEGLTKISLLPYHKIGSSKYKKFNLPFRMGNVVTPSAGKMSELKEFFSTTGVKVKIGG